MKSRALTFVAVAALTLVAGLAWWLGMEPADGVAEARTTPELHDAPDERRPLEIELPTSDPVSVPRPPADAASAEREERGAAAFEKPERPRGVVRVRVLWSDSKAPAADVYVNLYRAGAAVLFDAVTRRTDSEGFAEFRRVEAGPVIARSCEQEATGELAKGKQLELELTVPRGVSVEGRVTDEYGRSVSQAVVWLVAETWTELAECDSTGRYRIANLPPGASLAANARERSPSEIVRLRAEPGSTQQLDFIVGGPGCSVLGQVLDPNEQPIEGAVVFLARVDPSENERPARSQGARVANTDAEGRFEIHGVAPGPVQLLVRSEEFAPASDACETIYGQRTERILRLTPAAELIGVATEDGKPLVNATVRVGDFGEGEPLALFAVSVGVSDSKGRYRITGLAPGAQPVIVKRRAAPREVARRDEVVLVEGRAVVWNVDLPAEEAR